MIERLMRRAVTSRARDSTDKCADIVFCGTARAFAISPAASPSGSCLTSSRNTSGRVDCANPAHARIVGSVSIYPELWIYCHHVNRKHAIISIILEIQLTGPTDSNYLGSHEAR